MTFLESTQFMEILIVEDNPADAHLIMEAFNDLDTKPKIKVIADSVKALNYLYKKGKYRNCKTPQLILLDLNLPKNDSQKLLKEIRNNDKLKLIPVVIFNS